MNSVLTIDIGGTRIKSALFVNGEIVKTHSVLSHGSESRDAILAALDETIRGYEGFDVISVSSAGRFDPKAGVCVYASDNLKGWTGFHLKEYVEEKYGKPCVVDNDAACALLSQLGDCSQDTLMLTLGTGVGACLFKDGEIYRGENFDLGALQHIVINEDGARCDCGKCGCAEKELSGTGLHRIIDKWYPNESVALRDFFVRVRQGEEKALGAMKEYFDLFEVYLAKVRERIPSLKRIVLSGGAVDEVAFASLLKRHPEIRIADEPNLCGVKGAYRLYEKEQHGIR